MAEEKSHKPSARKLKKARSQGKVLKSAEISFFCKILIVILATYLAGNDLWLRTQFLLKYTWLYGVLNPELVLSFCIKQFLNTLVLYLSLIALSGILSEILQTGLHFEWQNLSPKISRLNVITGFQNLFARSKSCFVALLRLALFSLVFYWFFRLHSSVFVSWFVSAQVQADAVRFMWAICGVTICIIAFWSLFDLWLQRRKFYRELSMSHDELKREFRDQEGDPHIKSSRIAEYQGMLQQDLIARVRNSKVIIVERR